MKRLLIPSFIAGFAAFTVVYATEDTPNQRQQEAERYLNANPPEAMFRNIVENTTNLSSDKDGASMADTLANHLDMVAVSNAMKTAMIRHFTAEELAVLADFYSDPIAKSALGKMQAYMLDVKPVVQSEIAKAQQKTLNGTTASDKNKPAHTNLAND